MYTIDSIEGHPHTILSEENLQEALKLTEVVEDYFWKKHSLVVVRDGHMEDGTRIHFIRGYEGKKCNMLIMDNAFVIRGCYNET